MRKPPPSWIEAAPSIADIKAADERLGKVDFTRRLVPPSDDSPADDSPADDSPVEDSPVEDSAVETRDDVVDTEPPTATDDDVADGGDEDEDESPDRPETDAFAGTMIGRRATYARTTEVEPEVLAPPAPEPVEEVDPEQAVEPVVERAVEPDPPRRTLIQAVADLEVVSAAVARAEERRPVAAELDDQDDDQDDDEDDDEDGPEPTEAEEVEAARAAVEALARAIALDTADDDDDAHDDLEEPYDDLDPAPATAERAPTRAPLSPVAEVAAAVIESMRRVNDAHERHVESLELETARRCELLTAQAELDAELIRLHARREAHAIISAARQRIGEPDPDPEEDDELGEIGETFSRFAETVDTTVTPGPGSPDYPLRS